MASTTAAASEEDGGPAVDPQRLLDEAIARDPQRSLDEAIATLARERHAEAYPVDTQEHLRV